MPVISVVIPRLKTNQLRWTFSGAFEVHCFCMTWGLFGRILKYQKLCLDEHPNTAGALLTCVREHQVCFPCSDRFFNRGNDCHVLIYSS